MTTWRIEEKHVSRMGEVRWLPVSGGYPTKPAAEVDLVRLAQRGGRERRIVEIQE